ncbi:MAG: PEP-CTERM sorting domain-containing protein [Phycisphaerae bacterium]|nr:PEP-CTERM sorting domain-containing protein [Phycisphaerae bacterium]
MSKRNLQLVCSCVFVLGILFGSGSAHGTMLSFDLSIEFSGATPPVGATPWLKATFDDGGTPGSVNLKLTTPNLSGTEFVSVWSFNLDPTLNLGDLAFSAPTKTGAFTDPVISTGVDAFKANGDGYYDIKLAFAKGGGTSKRFGVGDAVEYTITGIPSLTSSSFDFLSKPGGGHGPYTTAAHVQSIGSGGEDSGWVTVPEPATMSLVLLGGVGILLRRRKR